MEVREIASKIEKVNPRLEYWIVLVSLMRKLIYNAGEFYAEKE